MTPALLAVALLVVSFPAPASAAQEEELPRIFLEKKVYSDTAGGKPSFFEPHTVERGESLWKILGRNGPLSPDRYAEGLREFRRVNPKVADPSRLFPGQKILVPTGVPKEEPPEDGTTRAYTVRWGDTLLKILAASGVMRPERPRYLEAVRRINPSVKDVNRIYAGKVLRLPTPEYFAGAQGGEASAQARKSPEPAPPLPPSPSLPASGVPVAAGPGAVREAPAAATSEGGGAVGIGQDAMASGKPEAELPVPRSPAEEVSAVETGKPSPEREPPAPAGDTPYRGLLSELFPAIGEAWIDRGTMYLPLPSGGDVVLRMSDFPVVRFSGGREVIVDFRGGIPARVRDAISSRWGQIAVVSLAGSGGAGEAIGRILSASGYFSAKEGISNPLVMGETVSVALPARFVVQRSEESLSAGDLLLLKEVPESPGRDLLSVLRYARRLGIRVVPYTDDPKAREGFLVGIGEQDTPQLPVALSVPRGGGLPAVDFGLDLLGIPAKRNERIRIGGGGDGFQLMVSPERLFEAGGKKYVVDTGRISPAIRSILRDSGYAVFPAGKEVSGRDLFAALLRAAGIRVEERRDHRLAGGGTAGYELRVTGGFLSIPGPAGGKDRLIVLVRRKVHSATRVLLREFGVEIVDW